jgi:hypothetical protein
LGGLDGVEIERYRASVEGVINAERARRRDVGPELGRALDAKDGHARPQRQGRGRLVFELDAGAVDGRLQDGPDAIGRGEFDELRQPVAHLGLGHRPADGEKELGAHELGRVRLPDEDAVFAPLQRNLDVAARQRGA